MGDNNDQHEEGDPSSNDRTDDFDSELVEINEDELEEIDNDENNQDDEVVADMDDMELEATGGDLRDDSDVVFSKHEGSVFCVDVDSSTSSLAVTGGEDDLAYVWRTNDGEVLFTCSGHKDSVTCVGFNHDSSLIATADMSGLLKVWNVSTHEEIWSFEVADIEWITWHHAAPLLLAGTVDGEMWMWKLPGGDCRTFLTHGSACGVGKLFPDGKRACAGYEDGTVKVWDLKSSNTIHTISGHTGHHSSVTCLDLHNDNNLILSGSTDKTAKISSSQNGKVLGTFDCSSRTDGDDDDDSENSVEAVGFCSVQSLLATGTLKGSLTIWDSNTQKARHQIPHEAGIVRLIWDKTSPVLYTGSLDGTVRLFDARSGSCEGEWTGNQAEILDLKLSKNGKFIITSGDDSTSRIFSLHKPDR